MSLNRQFAVLLVAVALVGAACGGTEDTTTSDARTSLTTLPIVTTTSSAPTTTEPPATTTTSVATTTTIPGEPIDIGPREGDVLAVVGVSFDDVLNVRANPGTDFEVITTLAPTEDAVIAKGNAWLLPDSIWFEVDVDGVVGWSSARFLAFLGVTDDITSKIEAQLGGLPSADTMVELGRTIAESQGSGDNGPPRIRVVVAPSVGDLGEVTYDVIGLADDALFGLRLHVFGTPDEDGVGFVLKSVEQTALCGRGVTSDGLCV